MKEPSNVMTYCVLGIMSGTSLDGLDMALVQLTKSVEEWEFDLISSVSIPYSLQLQSRLKASFNMKKEELKQLDMDYGGLIGNHIKNFIKKTRTIPDFIGSHGHTVFHQPEKGITYQIGSAKEIFNITNIPVIYDFRSKDVSLGGQGAPLVPIGDRYLFSKYDYCLNLGGIANISFESGQNRIAFDISPFNMAMNYLAQQTGAPFDNEGQLAKEGKLNVELLNALNTIPYYDLSPPKSLGYEDFLQFWKPVIDQSSIPVEDKLRTVCEHLAFQFSRVLASHNKNIKPLLLITGGGAFNRFFISKLKEAIALDVIIPDRIIIEFKEAIIFAFLAVLRFRNEPNCLSSVTGAKFDSSGGKMYGF